VNILIITHSLLDKTGSKLALGGVQSYGELLVGLLGAQGHNVTVAQLGSFELKVWRFSQVIGVESKDSLRRYYNKSHDKFDLTIFLYFDFARWSNPSSKSIAVQHGVEFDGFYPVNQGIRRIHETLRYIFHYRMSYRHRVKRIFRNCQVVCVDTNWMSWVRITYPFRRFEERMHYLPNTVNDRDAVEVESLRHVINSYKIVLIPRRFEKMRGVQFIVPVIKRLLKEHNDIFIVFAGSGRLENYIKEELKDYSNSFIARGFNQSEMRWLYERAFITLVPTLYSEGTSISALEALKYGSILVTSQVGGLNDIVLNGHNGYSLRLISKDWINCINELIKSETDDALRLKRQGLNVYKTVFDYYKWSNSWMKIINELDI
jgi:glycosyltransferase involved in cell wall biosynthesis